MTGFGTSEEAMQAGANAVESATQAIRGHISTLRSEAEQMMSAWKGEAAGAFSSVHASFEENAARINSALQQMHEALVATHRTYGTQESNQSQTFTNMNSQINS
ncbi:MAG TPA: WXG100 family type VII secretion target [Jatrophihabitantaceae bacterium]